MQWYSYVYVTYTPRMALTGGSAADVLAAVAPER